MELAFQKPGKKKKHHSKIKPPTEKHCRKLGYVTGTERWCHAESRIIKGGTGIMGGKISRDKVAWLSAEADAELSQPLEDATQAELEAHEKEWDRLIKLSH